MTSFHPSVAPSGERLRRKPAGFPVRAPAPLFPYSYLREPDNRKIFAVGAAGLRRTGHDDSIPSRQIQRRMLAMMAIWASQPAVKASVRAAGMPVE